MFKGDGHQLVNRRFIQREGEEFNHLARGLDELMVARLQVERMFMMELRSPPLKCGPAPHISRRDARQPVNH